MMQGRKSFITGVFLLVVISLSCGREKNPPRDEIPAIKTLLGEFENAVKNKNAAGIDLLIISDAYELGYHASVILAGVYSGSNDSTFHTFGRRSFSYTKDKALVSCFIMADSSDPGRPVEITLVKAADRWLIKRFDLK